MILAHSIDQLDALLLAGVAPRGCIVVISHVLLAGLSQPALATLRRELSRRGLHLHESSHEGMGIAICDPGEDIVYRPHLLS